MERLRDRLAALGLNLEDSTMTLLRGHFAMMLIAKGDVAFLETLGPLIGEAAHQRHRGVRVRVDQSGREEGVAGVVEEAAVAKALEKLEKERAALAPLVVLEHHSREHTLRSKEVFERWALGRMGKR